jgi:membrane-associated phospholipid phosphatase
MNSARTWCRKTGNKAVCFIAAVSFCLPALAQTALPSDAPNLPANSTSAADHDGILTRQYGRMLVKDVTHTLAAPADWSKQDWQRAGLAGAAILGTGLLLDRPIRDAARRHQSRGLDRFVSFFEPFGAEYSYGVLGGFYLAGALGNNPKAMHVAQDGLASTVVAAGIITPTLKLAFGRSRPRDNEGTGTFRPFNGSGYSFPSGHVTQAFAVASVVAKHYEEKPWVPALAYGAAGMVGAARIYHDAHFASDVVAGALIGTVVGNSIVGLNARMRKSESKVSFAPMITPEATGIMMHVRF